MVLALIYMGVRTGMKSTPAACKNPGTELRTCQLVISVVFSDYTYSGLTLKGTSQWSEPRQSLHYFFSPLTISQPFLYPNNPLNSLP